MNQVKKLKAKPIPLYGPPYLVKAIRVILDSNRSGRCVHSPYDYVVPHIILLSCIKSLESSRSTTQYSFQTIPLISSDYAALNSCHEHRETPIRTLYGLVSEASSQHEAVPI